MFNNKSQCVGANENTIDIKHANACVVWNFSLFLSFEQVDIESK
jgi:hypothetical protein